MNRYRMLSLLLVLAMLFQVSGAFATTEEEWNAQCVNKTIAKTAVYAKAGDKDAVVTLDAGTYVQTHAYDALSQRWNISYLDGETIKDGYVSALDLTIAVASITLEDGSIETIPESLVNQPEEIADYLNSRYSDRVFRAEDGIVISEDAAASAAEEKEAPAELTEETAPADEPVVETIATPAPTVFKGIVFSTEESEEDTPEEDAPEEDASEAVQEAAAEATPTPVPQVTALPADQYEVPDELKNVVLIGTNTCYVEKDGQLSAVKTTSIPFSDTDKKNKMVAFARANAEGSVQLLAEPNPRSRVLGYLKTGTLMGVVKAGSNYTRVYVDGVVGCVKNNMIGYVTVGKKPTGKAILTVGGTIDNTVTVNVLSASSRYYIVDSLPCGLQVDIWEKKGNTYLVEANGMRVWVDKSNLTQKSSMDGMVEQTPWVHLMEEAPSLKKTVTNAGGTQEVWDNGKSYNMHRDPYN